MDHLNQEPSPFVPAAKITQMNSLATAVEPSLKLSESVAAPFGSCSKLLSSPSMSARVANTNPTTTSSVVLDYQISSFTAATTKPAVAIENADLAEDIEYTVEQSEQPKRTSLSPHPLVVTSPSQCYSSREEKVLAKMGRRYMRLMTDNKWIVDLEKMGRNLDTLRYREKQMRQHEKKAAMRNLVDSVPNAQSNVD